MRISLVLLCLFFSAPLTAQSLLKEKITGEWICEKVTFVKGNDFPDTTSQQSKMMMKSTREAFTNASFIFGANGLFRLKLGAAGAKGVFAEQASMMNGKPWALNPSSLIIDISPKENLMSIRVLEKDGVDLFHLMETGIVLKMKKLDPSVKGS